MAMNRRDHVAESLSAFATWLSKFPVEGDPIYSGSSVRYQVARYCDYLAANPWTAGDPLREHSARDGAVGAYAAYLEMFNTPAATIVPILASLDRFYVFLGLGAVVSDPPRRITLG
jgi:hypothetical protein